MKKKSHAEEIRRGLDMLEKIGVAIEKASPDLVPRLKEQFGKERATDLAVIFALGKIADHSAAKTLLDLEQSARDKDVKKEIRRSLFKVMQKGVAIPQATREETPVPAAILKQTPEIEGYMSSVDGAGGRLVWIARPDPGQGVQFLQAMVSDREGLQRAGGTVLRRKELRKMAQDIKEQHGVAMISVPWEYADAIVYDAYEKAKTLGRSGEEVEEFPRLRSIFIAAKPKPQRHPVYQRIDSERAREGAWRELSRRLLDEPEFRFWFLDEDWIRPYLTQLEEAQTSRLVLNPIQKEERFAGIVRDVVKMLFSQEIGKLFQRRMEDMALYLLETGRAEPARLAAAVAQQIGDGDPGPLDISFLTGLVQKSFAFYASQEKTKPQDEPSLIVKP